MEMDYNKYKWFFDYRVIYFIIYVVQLIATHTHFIMQIRPKRGPNMKIWTTYDDVVATDEENTFMLVNSDDHSKNRKVTVSFDGA